MKGVGGKEEVIIGIRQFLLPVKLGVPIKARVVLEMVIVGLTNPDVRPCKQQASEVSKEKTTVLGPGNTGTSGVFLIVTKI